MTVELTTGATSIWECGGQGGLGKSPGLCVAWAARSAMREKERLFAVRRLRFFLLFMLGPFLSFENALFTTQWAVREFPRSLVVRAPIKQVLSARGIE
jgi:hypothetical protein